MSGRINDKLSIIFTVNTLPLVCERYDSKHLFSFYNFIFAFFSSEIYEIDNLLKIAPFKILLVSVVDLVGPLSAVRIDHNSFVVSPYHAWRSLSALFSLLTCWHPIRSIWSTKPLARTVGTWSSKNPDTKINCQVTRRHTTKTPVDRSAVNPTKMDGVTTWDYCGNRSLYDAFWVSCTRKFPSNRSSPCTEIRVQPGTRYTSDLWSWNAFFLKSTESPQIRPRTNITSAVKFKEK